MNRGWLKRICIWGFAFSFVSVAMWLVLLHKTGFNAVTGVYRYSPGLTRPDRFFVESGPENAITEVISARVVGKTSQLPSLDRFEPLSVTVHLYSRYYPVARVDGVYVWKDGTRSTGRYCLHATGGGAESPIFALINGGFRARFGVLSSTVGATTTPFFPVVVNETIGCDAGQKY
jgi:hypothetical protein